MSDPTPAVYHCPSCGALETADPADDGLSVCGKCGHEFRRPIRVAPRHSGPRAEGLGKFVQRDVVSRRRLVERDQSVSLAELPPPVEVDKIAPDHGDRRDDEVVSDDGHKRVIRRRKRKRRTNRRPYIYTAMWLLVVVLAFFQLKSKFNSSMSTVGGTDTTTNREDKAKAAELRAYLQEHFGECQQVLGEYFNATDPAEKAQFVYDPLRVTPVMDRFTSERGRRRPSSALTAVKTGVIVRDSYRGIETLWKSEDDEEFEVTFIRSEGAWRIDWEALVGYSTTPWPFFLGGLGPSEGEFRLFMREVQLTSTGEGEKIGMKFYPPVYDATLRHRGESPTVLIPSAGPLGENVRGLFDQHGEKPGWGDPTMQERDPDDLIRVRAVLEWRGPEIGTKHLYLKELKAGNWLADGLEEGGEEGVEEEEEGEEEGVEEDPGEKDDEG